MMPNPFRMVNPFLPADEGPPENPFRAATAKAVFGDDSFIQTPAPTESVVPGRLEARFQEMGLDPVDLGKKLVGGTVKQAGMLAGGAAGMGEFAKDVVTGTPASEAVKAARVTAHKVEEPIAGFADRTFGKPESPLAKIADFIGLGPAVGDLAKGVEASEIQRGLAKLNPALHTEDVGGAANVAKSALQVDDISARRVGMPRDLQNDINLLGEERDWTHAVTTPGAEVTVESRNGSAEVRGRVIEGAADPVNGEGKAGRVLVEHEMEGRPVQRWYPATQVTPETPPVASNPFREPSAVTLHTPGAVVGAAVGGTAGSQADDKNPGRGMLLGALTGAVVGAGAGKFAKALAARPGVADDAISEALGAKKAFAGEVNPDEFVNVSKFALDPSGEARLRGEVDRVVREKGLAPKQKITWEETKALASSMGLDKIDGKVGRLDGPKMLAIRNIVSQNVEALDGLYKKVNGGGIDVGERGAVDGQIAVLEKQNDALLSRFVKARSQTGRDLNNLKILANRTMDPVIWRTKAENLVKQGGKVLSPEQRMTIDRLTNTGDRQGLVKYIASLRPTSVGEKLTTVWKAGLLTAPPTHLANIMGNVGMAALETAKDLPASIVDRLLSVATKQRTKSFSVARTARATLTAAKDGVEEARLAAKGLPTRGASLEKWDQFRYVDLGHPIANAYKDFIFRSLEAQDAFFKSFAYQRALSEQLALNGGKMTDEAALQAIDAAETATFQNKGALAELAAGAKSHIRKYPKVAAAVEVIAPFTRTPANVVSRVAEYSPLGFLKSANDMVSMVRGSGKLAPAEMRSLQKAASETAGRAATGTAPILAGYYLAKHGLMTGARPSGTSERSTWDLEGKQENAVLIGGKWRSVTRISPIGNLMALGANLYYLSQQPGASVGQVAAAGAGSIGTTVSEQSFLRGAQDASEALKDPMGQGMRYAQNLATSVVPSIVQRGARALDPVVRQPKTFSEAFKNRIPGRSEEVPAKVDQFGREAKRQGGWAEIFDPFSSRPDMRMDPVIKELDRIGATIDELRRKDMETEAEFQARKKEDGERLYARLQQVINHPRYKALPDEVKRDELESEIAKARSHYTRQRRHRSAA